MTSTPSSAVADRRIALGWCGPPEHGIPHTAQRIAAAATLLGFGGHVVAESDPTRLDRLVEHLPAEVRLAHLHVNDWLFADSGADPDRQLDALVTLLSGRDIALSVTLHDIPQLSDGAKLYARRANTYRHLVQHSIGVVVSSAHERTLLAEALDDRTVAVEVIPLPIDPLPIDAVPINEVSAAAKPGLALVDGQPSIGIFGYLYPGKGHREVLEELAGIEPAVSVIALGRPSDRHLDLIDELTQIARDGGNTFRCTGFIPESELAGQLRAVTVPLAPHTHISASGSINSWIAAGRRPLVPAGRYVAELDQRLPGAVWIYEAGGLPAAIAAALDDPAQTVLPAGFPVGPTTELVARRYLDWLRAKPSPGEPAAPPGAVGVHR